MILLLKTFSEAKGISGTEEDVRKIIEKALSDDSSILTKTDKIGNLYAKKFENDSYPNIVLFVPMDEPGFIITDITNDGYLKFDAIGDLMPKNIISKRVKFNDTYGIISFKAVHLSTKEERKIKIKFSDLYIDIGANSKESAKRYISVGDTAVFDTEFSEFGDGLYKGKALPARAYCDMAIKLIKNCNDINLAVVFTVQSEISYRGMCVAANEAKDMDIAVILSPYEVSESTKIKSGAVIGFCDSTDVLDEEYRKKLIEYAEKNKVKIQTAYKKDDGRRNIKRYVPNIPILSIGLPVNYKKSPYNVIAKEDIDYLSKILYNIGRFAEIEK